MDPVQIAALTSAFTAVIGFGGVAFGAHINSKANARNIEAQERLQSLRFERESRAARLSTISAMRRLVPLAVAAATSAHHNLRIWEPAVKVLCDLAADPATVLGFPSETDWHNVSDVAAEAALGLARLQGLPASPFETDLERRSSEVDNAQTDYVIRIRDVGERLHESLTMALRALSIDVAIIERKPIFDIVDDERRGRGQRSMMITRQDPNSVFLLSTRTRKNADDS